MSVEKSKASCLKLHFIRMSCLAFRFTSDTTNLFKNCIRIIDEILMETDTEVNSSGIFEII